MNLASYFCSLRFRQHLFQLVLVVLVGSLFWYLFHNASINMAARNMEMGFSFLWEKAGFPILFSPFIDYDAALHSYFDTFLVGLGNTVLVSVLGIITATIIGFIIGIARLSNNWLVARFAAFYVETFRNIPLLLQISFWYFAILIPLLPSPRQSLTFLGDMFVLNNRGFYLPMPEGSGIWFLCIGLVVAVIGIVFLVRFAERRIYATGQKVPVLWISLALLCVVPSVVLLLSGAELSFSLPEKGRFAWTGGWVIIPELAALWLALTIYTGAFIAENIRGGILSVHKGQTEAALSLGLTRGQALRFVVIPQALRVIIPPQTSQYLNLAKNSSLAAAVGYPDLVAVFTGTALNQIGKAIEIVSMTMLVYLSLSLTISAAMNAYNKKMRLKER